MSGLRRRWVGIVLGIVSWGYLLTEDAHVQPILGMALLWMWWLFPPRAGRPLRLAGTMLAVPWLAALIMVLKNGVHGHAVPDFPNTVILSTLARSPWWGAAGGLLGAAWRLWHPTRER